VTVFLFLGDAALLTILLFTGGATSLVLVVLVLAVVVVLGAALATGVTAGETDLLPWADESLPLLTRVIEAPPE
jgi:hypothetical protein